MQFSSGAAPRREFLKAVPWPRSTLCWPGLFAFRPLWPPATISTDSLGRRSGRHWPEWSVPPQPRPAASRGRNNTPPPTPRRCPQSRRRPASARGAARPPGVWPPAPASGHACAGWRPENASPRQNPGGGAAPRRRSGFRAPARPAPPRDPDHPTAPPCPAHAGRLCQRGGGRRWLTRPPRPPSRAAASSRGSGFRAKCRWLNPRPAAGAPAASGTSARGGGTPR